MVYEAYVAESLKNISENVANGIGGEGAVYMAKSYIDIIHPKPEPKETADEIIGRIREKLQEYEQ